MSLRVYIAAGFIEGRKAAQHAKKVLEQKGYESVAHWIDTHLMADVSSEIIAREVQMDLRDIQQADVFVYLNENPSSTGGMHTEFGYALSEGCQMIVVGKPTNVFHFLPKVKQYDTVEDIPNADF